MNDNTKGGHVPRQGVDHLEGQLDLIEHALAGAPPKPFEDLPDNVEIFPANNTSLNLPVNRILQGAHDAQLTSVVVLGYTKEGHEYYASSDGDPAEAVWLMERSKHRIMTNLDERGGDAPPITPTKA